MFRTSATLIASFALLAACATASSNSSNSNPPTDAGKVTYDVGGQPNAGGSNDGGAAGDGGSDAGGTAVKARDTTLTRGAGVGPKVVKRVPTTKPPKPEPTEPAKPKKGRFVTPNGLLGEAFSLAGADKLPDFTTVGAPKAVFIAPTLDSSATAPLAGLPAGVATPVALRFTGSLNVTEAAEYNLCTSSQDGSQILLENTVVVDNDGVKKDGPAELCELVALDPGEYAIEVRTFHVTGPIIVRLAWAKGKDGTPEAISTRNLFKPADADARVKAGK